MNNVEISKNFDFTSKEKIKLYKNIFGESPRNEGFICKYCGKIYNIRFMGKCSCGKNELKPFYKNNELKETFNQLSINIGYNELIAKILNNEIGFIWGWKTSLEQLNISKLGLTENQINFLMIEINKLYPYFTFENFYYLAEIGVKSNYRGEDIAGKLYRNNLEQIKNDGIDYILLRTTKKSDVPYKWFLKEGYKDIFSYNDEQDRVILILKI